MAVPVALSIPVPNVVVPSRNVTVPVGVADPDAAVTTALKVRLLPATADAAELESAVFVATPAVTVTVTAEEVLPLKLASPL
jgi:hypothetical protein